MTYNRRLRFWPVAFVAPNDRPGRLPPAHMVEYTFWLCPHNGRGTSTTPNWVMGAEGLGVEIDGEMAKVDMNEAERREKLPAPSVGQSRSGVLLPRLELETQMKVLHCGQLFCRRTAPYPRGWYQLHWKPTPCCHEPASGPHWPTRNTTYNTSS